MPFQRSTSRRLAVAGLLACSPAVLLAQSATAADPAPARAPAPQRVEVTGGKVDDTAERRQSTAAKIIVGRDEIEKFGDASLGELIKRLPGVTMDGRAGRGGNIRMRGLGGGYTQILLDGERVQGGLSLDAIDPDQVERIEILRAPTAETGARAIAGTINIITREGFRKRLNDLKLSLGGEAGRVGEHLAWSRDDKWDETLNYNLALSAFGFRRGDTSATTTSSRRLDQTETASSVDHRHGLHASARIQWRPTERDQWMLMPMLIASNGGNGRDTVLDVPRDSDPNAKHYATSRTDADNSFRLARLNTQWKRTLEQGARIEMQAGMGRSASQSTSRRVESDAQPQPLRQVDERTRSTERNGHLNAKLTKLLAGEHNLVSGLELDAAQRDESRVTLQDGKAQLVDFGTDFQAATRRVAVFAQDEWSLNPNWAVHAGLRWEGIRTRGQDGTGATPTNRSSVVTPLLHALWKPDPKGRDQVRMSLTRSYRSPTLANLLGRPTLSPSNSFEGDNRATSPDRAGNPLLRPELATGLDLAFEHYLAGGGLLSANLFHRRITDLMRTVTTLETVPWSDRDRWVARPRNLGGAITQGIELEAKGRLNDMVEGAPPLDLRANLSVFRSRVDSVAGPDNRLDQQPGGTANLGADYKLPGWPLTLGGNLNWTPGYTTRLSETQWVMLSRKRVLDAYALWQISSTARLRLSASNLAPEDAINLSQVEDETATVLSPTHLSWRLQLELKL